MRIREEKVEEQVQYVLIYVQEGLVDVWKKNLLKKMKVKEIQFVLVGDFLAELKREFGRGDNESAKVAKLKRVE